MALDLLTLYIVILLNSLTVSVIWAAIAASYPTLEAARYWLASCILTTLGGAVLAIQGNAGALVPAVAGNALVIFGFFQMWVGVRRFFGLPGKQNVAVLLTAVAIALMLATAGDDRARSIVYSLGQGTPMILGIITLGRVRPQRMGRAIAAFAMAVGAGGHALTVASNALVMTGRMEFSTFYQLASYDLLTVIFSAVVWNFGFTVMTIGRLRAEVIALAERDDLTGLANRRKLNNRLEREEALAVATGQPYAVLIMDLDRFKDINDTFGHAAGDAALVHVAAVAAGLTRSNDLLARMGGDELCLLLPGCNLEGALRVARELAETIRQTPLQWKAQSIPMTLSIGVAQRMPGNDGHKAVLAAADAGLYEVKRAGRDGVSALGQATQAA